MYAYVWLKEQNFKKADEIYEIWHTLKFLVQEINRCNADLEKCHPLDRGFLTDRRNEAIAKHTGTMEAREIVAGLKNNLERLTGWHD